MPRSRLRKLLLLLVVVLVGAALAQASLANSIAVEPWIPASASSSAPKLLGLVHPGLLAAFQVLVSLTALVAFSPDE